MGECSRRSLKTFVLLSLVILANFQIGASQSNEATVKSLAKTAPNNPRIVIIGAGVAGIAAASKLFQNGFKNVTILEAENRIGGRINTTKLGDYTVELGAQWVYGDDGNVAFKLAKDLGVIDKSEQTDNLASRQYLDSQGNPVDEALTKNITEFYTNNVRNAKFGNTTADQSLGEYVEKLFNEQFGDRSEIMKEKKKLLHHLESSMVSLEYAESWRDITASGGYQHRKFSGDQRSHWKNRGYSTILDILMKRYPDAEKELPVMKNTILNTEVMSIDYLQDVVGPPVFITTTKGQLYKADHVIVTVSLGVLKAKHMSLFIPPLPDFKVKTIESLGFGNIAKIYLLFEKPFWELGDKKVVQFNFLWNDADRDLIEADPEKMWVLGLSKVTTVQHKPNLLELWVAGKYAKSMELLTDVKVLNHTIETLQRFLYKQYRVSAPKAMLRSRWYTNPHFRGTTSYRSIEAQKIKVHSEMVEKPLFPQNLTILFAGEATVKDKYATVDGAIASGWKAANRLLDHYKKQLPIPE